MYKYPAPSEARQVSAQLVIMLPRCRAGTTTMTRITGAGSDRWPCAEPCRTSRSRISDCRCHCRYHDRTTQQPMRSCRCQRTRHVSTSSPNEPSSPAFLLPQHGASLIKSPRSLAALQRPPLFLQPLPFPSEHSDLPPLRGVQVFHLQPLQPAPTRLFINRSLCFARKRPRMSRSGGLDTRQPRRMEDVEPILEVLHPQGLAREQCLGAVHEGVDLRSERGGESGFVCQDGRVGEEEEVLERRESAWVETCYGWFGTGTGTGTVRDEAMRFLRDCKVQQIRTRELDVVSGVYGDHIM
jgi:hypothetical protein